MTFYEAALRILEEAGSPLHSLEITKRSLDKGLLSHIGKTPEITMLSRLAAMAKRSRERKIMVTSRDTFALTDWMLPEDEAALTATGAPEVNPEENLPPMRSVERHPEPRAEYLRSIGRQAERKRRGDDERRKKLPPVSEVAFELLTESQSALVPSELLARMKSRELVQDDLGVLSLIEALAADNQQRIDQNRRPQFAAIRAESSELQLSLEVPVAPEGGPSLVELQQAFCQAAQLHFENGRVVLRSQRRAAVAEMPDAPSVALSGDDVALVQAVKASARDARRAMARLLRQKLSALDSPTFEKTCVRLLHGLHFRELKVARRSKDGPLLTARRKDGNLELRYAIRVMKQGAVERRVVQDLRREIGHTGAQLGLVIGTGDVRSEARSDATGTGALVLLWCADALAEKFFEAQVGVSVTQVELFDIDEAFFAQAKIDADEQQKRREERHRERDDQSASAPRSSAPSDGDAAPTPPPRVQASSDTGSVASNAEDDSDEGDDEGEVTSEFIVTAPGAAAQAAGAPGAEGEGGRRRKRRRRRRRGGGGGQGQPGAAAAPGAQATAPSGGDALSAPALSDAPAPAPAPKNEPSGGGGGSEA